MDFYVLFFFEEIGSKQNQEFKSTKNTKNAIKLSFEQKLFYSSKLPIS